MPDIDMDFDERRRGDMIRYATEKYGEERVAPDHHLRHHQGQGSDQGRRPGARLPVRAGRPHHQGDAAAGDGQGHPARRASSTRATRATTRRRSSARSTRPTPDVQQGRRHRQRPRGPQAPVGRARGRRDHVQRAAARRHPDPAPRAGRRDHHPVRLAACETLGLLKMDFLGLRNLTVLDDCLRNIEANRGETVVLEDLALDDAATYELLARGDTLGVFQLDGGADARAAAARCSRTTSRTSPPSLALYRPGPDGRQRPQRLRRPQERPQAGRRRSTPSSPSRSRRSSARPTA